MPKDFNDNDIEWQITEVSKGSKRTVKIHGYRVSRARLEQELSSSMLDASKEIDRAYEDRERKNHLGTKTVNLTGMGGGRDRTEEILEAMNNRIDRLIQWEKACTPILRHAVYALNQHGHSAKSYAEFKGVTPLEAILWYKEGLRVYCKLFGLN